MSGEVEEMREFFESALSEVRFRDWTFRLAADGCRFYLQVEFEAPDSFVRAGGHPRSPETQRGRKWFLSPHMTRSEVVQTALMAVLAAVEHEAREDFRYRGAAIFGPHFHVDGLWSMAKTHGALDVRT